MTYLLVKKCAEINDNKNNRLCLPNILILISDSLSCEEKIQLPHSGNLILCIPVIILRDFLYTLVLHISIQLCKMHMTFRITLAETLHTGNIINAQKNILNVKKTKKK